MIRLVWLFLIAAALAVGAALLAGQQGAVTIVWGNAEFRMAPAVAAAIAFAAVALILGVWRLIGIVFDWPGAMSHWRRERRRKAGYLALARGMVAVAAGDAREARRQQARARSGHGEPLLSQLLAAQTAQLEGDEDAAAEAYADMLGRPETEFLGLRGLFMQALRRGDTAAARRHAARAFALRPQTQLFWPDQDDPDVVVVGDRTGALKAWFDAREESVMFLRPDRCIAGACIAQRAPELSAALIDKLTLIPGGNDGPGPLLHVAQPAAERARPVSRTARGRGGRTEHRT